MGVQVIRSRSAQRSDLELAELGDLSREASESVPAEMEGDEGGCEGEDGFREAGEVVSAQIDLPETHEGGEVLGEPVVGDPVVLEDESEEVGEVEDGGGEGREGIEGEVEVLEGGGVEAECLGPRDEA